MNWQIKVGKRATKTIVKLDKGLRNQVMDFIENKLAGCSNPRSFGTSLTGDLSGLWRYRVGKFRIICHLDDQIVTVFVLEVDKRDQIYKHQSITWH